MQHYKFKHYKKMELGVDGLGDLNVTIQTCYLLRLTCLHNLGTRFRVRPMFPHDGKNKHISQSTLKSIVFLSLLSPPKTNNVWKMWVSLSLTIYRKVGVKKERKKRGIPSTTEFQITNVFVTQKYRDLFYSLSRHHLMDMFGIMWCASCSGDFCRHHTMMLVWVVVYSNAK